jgi:hypothetical protein
MYLQMINRSVLAAPLFAGFLLASPPTPTTAPTVSTPAVSAPAVYWGRIDRTWANFDVWRGGYKGVLVHVTFRTNGLFNTPCKAIAYFAYSGGTLVEDFNGVYTSSNGQVTSSADFTPSYENSTYSDLQIFLPYDELHLGAGNYTLQFHVQLYSTLHQQHFAVSEVVPFTYRKG